MKSLSKTAEMPPVDPGRGLLIGSSILVGDRDPQSIRRWIVEWIADGDQFGLAGPLDFATDLGNALFELRGSMKPEAVFLWPCVRGHIGNGFKSTPVQVYVTARETLRRFQFNEVEHEGWARALREVGFELPSVVGDPGKRGLLELSERAKAPSFRKPKEEGAVAAFVDRLRAELEADAEALA